MGEFFDKMINSIGLDRTSCYICNIVPYKPLSIGFNMASEVKRFMPFTKKLIELVKPKLIIILGGVALKAITKSDKGLSSLRGEFFKYKNNDDVEIMSCAIFHPSYLIKNPIAKRVAYKDLLEIKKTLNNL
ncbi:MAG: Uracil DNA glycosylase superfamily protein [Alphaproteobacteria bacterium ADurb.Bin438]|nr:MAG: Uracil DNA glycosylase superfamily protein [Alphaproteobacteria bacterium ADurb.Bin438]